MEIWLNEINVLFQSFIFEKETNQACSAQNEI